MFNLMVEHAHESLNLVFSAIADPTRRAILRALEKHPSTITELARPFPVSLNAVSKHVMILERAGLVRREIRGREHLCALDARPLHDANEWISHYRQFWEVRLDAFERYVAKRVKAGARKGTTTHGRTH
jgi:DNA-binding transcriptional ArsR family regulator